MTSYKCIQQGQQNKANKMAYNLQELKCLVIKCQLIKIKHYGQQNEITHITSVVDDEKKVVGGKQLHNYKRNSEETKMTVTFDNSKGDYPNTVSLTNNVSL